MAVLHLPVRYYRDYAPHHDYETEVQLLKSNETAFLLVDVDTQPAEGDRPNEHAQDHIVPALKAARDLGMLVAYVHNDWRLVADYGNVMLEVWAKTKRLDVARFKRGAAFAPKYTEALKPKATESDFPKRAWSGFVDTPLEAHLRANEIRNIVAVGYNLRACFYLTLVDAVVRNFRVVALRDATRATEMPDTIDERQEEGGWIAKVHIRQIEHLIGGTMTSLEFVQACHVAKSASDGEAIADG